jgi:hypothetical protein
MRTTKAAKNAPTHQGHPQRKKTEKKEKESKGEPPMVTTEQFLT